MRVFTRTVPKEVAQFTTGFDQINSDGMLLEPDNWGKINFTLLLVVFYKFFPILFGQLDKTKKKSFESQKDLDNHNLELVCMNINPMIDKYCIATDNSVIRRVSPSDFLAFQAWQDFPGEDKKFNHFYVFLRCSTAALVPPPSEPKKEITERMKEIAKYSDLHKVALGLMLEAYRAAEVRDYLMAAIQASMAMESVLENFISERVRMLRNKQGKRLIPKKIMDDTRRSRNLATNLNIFLPLVIGDEDTLDTQIIRGCDEIRKQRNFAVHQDTSKFDDHKVVENLPRVSQLLNWIVERAGTDKNT